MGKVKADADPAEPAYKDDFSRNVAERIEELTIERERKRAELTSPMVQLTCQAWNWIKHRLALRS